METIEQLMAEEKEMLKKLDENIEKQKEIKIKSFCKKHGIYLGDTVEFYCDRKEVIGVVSGFHFLYSKEPSSYRMKLFKNNGELGVREVHMWPSGKVKLIKRANEQ